MRQKYREEPAASDDDDAEGGDEEFPVDSVFFSPVREPDLPEYPFKRRIEWQRAMAAA